MMRHSPAQRGVTLIELMVGLVIGLFVTVVIAQVLVASEGRRRTTTTGADAQVNGALALFALQRDIQMAGYGMTAGVDGIGCEVRARRNGVDFTWTLAPVVIADGAAGAPDSLLVLTSAKPNYSVPSRIVVDHPRTAANFFLNTTVGIADGDLMLAVPRIIDANNWCSVFNVTGTGGGGGGGGGGGQGQGQGQNQINHNSGNGGAWNQPGGSTIFPNAGYPAGSYVVNLGQFVTRGYQVSAAQALQLQTFDTSTAATDTDDLFPQIVNLQAFYGKDTDNNGTVDTYDTITPTTNAGWRQVLAVRVAVVARSTQRERDPVTTLEPRWDVGNAATVVGSTACGASQCVTIKVDGLPDWQRYRYKVYDSLVPLRNMLWRS